MCTDTFTSLCCLLQRDQLSTMRRGSISWRLLLLQVLLLPALVTGFLGKSIKSFGFSQTSSSSALAMMMTTMNERDRNMFHDYNKPIVLVGQSSAANELDRLAKSLLTQHFSSSSQIVLGQTENLLDSIEKQQYQWPDIVLLDLASFGEESDFIEIAKSLHDNGLLSIFVNVDPDGSNMDQEARNRKGRLEESVFVKYSDYELCIKDEGLNDNDETWEHIEWELTRILARARLIPAIPGDTTRSSNTAHLTMGKHTFFLSLTFPEIEQVEPYAKEICSDVDAMEYRTDLLACRDSRFDLIYGMQLLRRYCRPHALRVPALPFSGTVLEDVMPIVYTVRTRNQAGTYPDDEEGIHKMFDLLRWGLRGGVEVIDVESAWDADMTTELLGYAEKRHSSQILGSHHVVGKEITTEEAVLLFEQCALDGRAHGTKVVLSIESDAKDRMAYEAALIASELAAKDGKPVIPNISLILGEVGQFSRVINLPFTPVTHEALPVVAAPGQMTASEIMTTRILTKIFDKKKYAILGHNIAYSVSPQMHGAAFAATKLPHEYIRVDVPSVEEFVDSTFFNSADFGGTSVTIPHKQAIIPHLDVLSESARAIGSVNTVIAKEEYEDESFKRVLYGDNTDWRGIFNPLNRLLGGRVDYGSDFALVLGAGGTARAAAYVATKLGLKRIYYNRTPSKAHELVDAFGGVVVTSLDEEFATEGMSLGDVLSGAPKNSVRVVISTLPAAANFVLPEWMLESDRERPIVFDVNYKPYNTKLLLQAEESGCNVVRGSEMLWEQGVGQFELWTERTAPYRVMKMVVLENCIEKKADAVDVEAVDTGTNQDKKEQ